VATRDVLTLGSARLVRPALWVLSGLAAGALVLPAVAGAAPPAAPGSAAHPTIASVKQQLQQLARRNDQLVERFDQAQQQVATDQDKADAAATAAAAAQRRLEAARAALGASAAAQYEGGTFSSAGALLASSSGSSYLDQLDTLSLLNDHNASMVSTFTAAKQDADTATATAQRLLGQARQQRDAVAKQRTQVSAEIGKYKQLLNKLTEAQRLAFLARQSHAASPAQVETAVRSVVHPVARTATSSSSPSIQSSAGIPAKAQIAINFALAQVGKPYVWGASGPGSYDCSGLTMASYAAAGISLPHSSLMQYNYGTHVSYGSLRPGDLVFFYQPIGHVAMYIGHGMLVSAPQTGENVMIVPLKYFMSDYVGATRLVG
jgi:cell wall-associated NlpC family hydrolase